jgi:hypothetical protein
MSDIKNLRPSDYPYPQLRDVPSADCSAMPCSASWLPIAAAPKDGTEIIVYCPSAHGLNHMVSVCAYHEDAGFCVCELREPILWIPLPNADMLNTWWTVTEKQLGNGRRNNE